MTTTHTIDVEAERVLFENYVRSVNPKALMLDRWPAGHYKNVGVDGHWRGWLAAKRSIQPAAPVLAAVGVEAQHQVADFCPECHAREGFPDGEELARFLASEYLSGTAAADFHGAKVTLRYKTTGAAEAALDAIADAVDGRIAAQPAVDHAKRAEGERAAFEVFARDACLMPPRATVNWDAVWTKAAWEGWQARGQQAGAAIPGEAK